MTKEEKRELKKQESLFAREAIEKRKKYVNQIEAKRQEEKEKQQSEKAEKKSKKRKSSTGNTKKIIKTTLDIFPVRYYEEDHFILDDGQLFDIYQIYGKSYYNASDEDITMQIEQLTYFFRIYKGDLKFVALNYPTNTQRQQAFLQRKLSVLPQFEEILNVKISDLKDLERDTTSREAFVILYAKNQTHFDTLKSQLFTRSSLRIAEITKEKKENILFLLNNMCKEVSI
ncbi:MAG: hypothetical protein RSC76_07290 [Oscillospiraceae bacterium]